MADHPLQTQIHRVARKARGFVLAHGVSRFLTVLVFAVVGLALTDYLIRFHDRGLRWIGSATLVAIVAWAARRFAWPALTYQPTDLQIAQRIECQFPQLQDRLSSTVAFLSQTDSDPTAGSARLRMAVVAEAAAQSQSLDFSTCLDAREPKRAAIVAALVLICGAIVAAIDPPSAVLAVSRLLVPWDGGDWPRLHQLEFVRVPDRIASGGDFEIEIVDRQGRLPDAVQFQLRYEDEPHRVHTSEMKPLGERMVFRLDNVSRPFQFRATGGDDDTMPWRRLDVLEPPRIVSQTVRMHPPTYTGWPVETAATNSTLQVLEGTRIQFQATTSKPLKSATLKTDGGVSLPLKTRTDGLGFELAASDDGWTVTTSGAYWFELVDQQELTAATARWEIRAVKDSPPTVTLESPPGDVHVTPEGFVAIKAVVKDDLAIRGVQVRYSRSDKSDIGEQSFELFTGPERVAAAKTNGLASSAERGESRVVERDWNLAELAFPAGTTVDFHLAASDYKPQTGQSTVRRLTIISREEFEERIGSRQSQILSLLAEALRLQRDARQQTQSLETQANVVGRLEKMDLDQLQSAELNQRGVTRVLAEPGESVLALVTNLLTDLTRNRVDNPDVQRRMEAVQTAVRELNREPLPIIQRELIAALKIARAESKPDKSSLVGSLSRAGLKQDEVAAKLEQLLGDLSQWDNYRRFAREFNRTLGEQQGLRAETDKLRMDTLAKGGDLSLQERANLKRLAQRQTDLARRFEKQLSRLEQMRERLQESEPTTAETMADALESARRAAISGRMRESSRQMESNQLGQSGETQNEVVDGLKELLDVLSNRREHELDRLVDKLRQASGELADLSREQKELLKKLDAAAKTPDEAARKRELERLSREEQRLAEQAQQLSRRLERLQRQSGEQVGQAGQHGQKSSEAAKQGDAQTALDEANKAANLLEEAEKQVRQATQQAEQDLLQQQLAKLEQQLAGLTKRQQAILDKTVEFESLRVDGKLTREQSISVQDLAEEQRSLAGEAGQFTDKLGQAEAFVLGLRGAIREMIRAANQLDKTDTGEATQQSERTAVVRLKQLEEALKPDPNPPENKPNEPNEQNNGSQMPDGGVKALAELKLLKLMQEEINRRTVELDGVRRKTGRLTDAQQRELQDLAQEQGRLADLLLNLLKSDSP